MKAQIDHLPLAFKGMRPTQGRRLAVMQVNAGSLSFNTVNTLRILGRWMRMFTIPNQSSVAKAYDEFDEAGRMKPFELLRPDRRCDGGAGAVYRATVAACRTARGSILRARRV
jgi:NAD(P)H-dependent FMN reductase